VLFLSLLIFPIKKIVKKHKKMMASWHQILIFGGELTRFSMFFPQLQLSEAWNLAWPPEARRSSWRGLKDFVQALLGDGWDGMEKLVEKPGFLEEKLRKRVSP
jgi:hypothetical protein